MRRTSFYAALALMLMVAACSSDNIPGIPGAGASSLSGKVVLYDEYDRVMTQHAEATVSIEGTSYKATTDHEGKWTIPNLPPGTYVLNYSKPGFVTYRFPGYSFVGGGTGYVSGTTPMWQIPSYTITSIQARIVDTAVGRHEKDSVMGVSTRYLVISGTISAPPHPGMQRTVHLYLGKDDKVSSQQAIDGSETRRIHAMVSNGSTSFVSITHVNDIGLPVSSGSTVYIVAYPGVEGDVMTHDPITNRALHESKSLQRSNVVGVMIP